MNATKTLTTVNQYVTAAAQLLPQLIALGMEIVPLIEGMLTVAKQDVPTSDQWDALDAQETALNARINDTSGDVAAATDIAAGAG
jgi:hypothetical protein